MALNEIKQLPIWQQMAAVCTPQETGMVEKHVEYIIPELEKYVDTFPTYTLHNRDHIYNVLHIMGKLLGDKVNQLHGLEAMVLILSAVYHDYGMIYSEEERQNISTYGDFKEEFLEIHPKAKILFKEAGESVSTELAEWYCRWAHATRVWGKLAEMEARIGALQWNDLPIRQFIGDVCASHNEPAEKIRVDDDRFKKDLWDVCDLRFCALLLRLADILDFDNSRSPQSVYDFLDLDNPKNRAEEISKDEWNKHMASRGFHFPAQPNGSPLKFLAAPPHPYIEQGIRNFLDLIDLELKAAQKVVSLCSEKWKDFLFPERINRDDILSKDYESGKYRFSLSEDKILDLLTGEGLYNNSFVFVRELLQNAIDTVRHRTFIERIDNPQFVSPTIQISYFKDPHGYYWLRVDDEGMGMDLNIISKHLLDKGNSYYQSDQFRLEKMTIQAKRNEDFVPISRFGIGLLACFIVCDKIEISTCYHYTATGQQREKTRLSIEGRGGYWVIRSEKKQHLADYMPSEGGWQKGYRNNAGTSIACRIKTSTEFHGLNIERIIEQFLLAPEIPIFFHGKKMGGDYEEMAITPWCQPSQTTISPEFKKGCSDLLNHEVESIVIEVRPINLTQMSATPDLKGQLVIVVPRIKVNNVPRFFSTGNHFEIKEEVGKTYLVCFKKVIGDNGREVRSEIRHDISNIIATINFPKKFLEHHELQRQRFIWPRISHNGIIVHDSELQLNIFLPNFDQYFDHHHVNAHFYLATGIFCFRDSLLPKLVVSRSIIQEFTVEIIAHVLFAARELNDYKFEKEQPYNFLQNLEGKSWHAEHYFSFERLEKLGLYENNKDYWNNFPCISTKTELISIDKAIGLAKSNPIVFQLIQYQSRFLTKFVQYMIVTNFKITHITDKGETYLEGRLSDKAIDYPKELRDFEPMQFIHSNDGEKIVLHNGQLNLQHPLIKWYVSNSATIKKEFSNYGHQIINELMSGDSAKSKADNVNEILERLRTILPADDRPNKDLNISEKQF